MNKRQRKKMQKTSFNFAVGSKTLEKYNKEVRNTRSKLNRLKREKGVDLTDEINIPSLSDFSSRKEFNTWVEKVQSFRDRRNLNYQFEQNEYGVSASKARLKKIEEMTKEAQKLADEQIHKYEDAPFISGGEVQGTVGLQRPRKTGIYRPKDFKFEEVRSKQRLDEIEEGMRNKRDPLYYDERNKRMQDNYVVALEGSFNSLSDELVKKIKEMHPDDFYQLYLITDEMDFHYIDTDGVMVTADEKTVEDIEKQIDLFNSGRLDLDLAHKNFS